MTSGGPTVPTLAGVADQAAPGISVHLSEHRRLALDVTHDYQDMLRDHAAYPRATATHGYR